MAIRMAQDLGMHKDNDEGYQIGKASAQNTVWSEDIVRPRESGKEEKVDENENSMQLNLFWSIYFIDRIISLGKCYHYYLLSIILIQVHRYRSTSHF